MFKNNFLIIIAVLIFNLTNAATNERIKVVVSFNAMKEFSLSIGKDLVEVVTIIPDGVEPHDFEPKATDLANLINADIFVYNGSGMESWVLKSLKSITAKTLISINASEGYKSINNTDKNQINEHGLLDPHIWLSLNGAIFEAGKIKDGFVKFDPKNKAIYEKNYMDFSNQLQNLFGSYKIKFDSLKKKSFVTGHASFAYLGREFGLKQNSIEDIFAEGEPSAKKLASLIEFCKKNNIKTIFIESTISSKVSETLAREIGGKVEKIYTIESNEDNKNYLERMKENLEKLYISLK